MTLCIAFGVPPGGAKHCCIKSVRQVLQNFEGGNEVAGGPNRHVEVFLGLGLVGNGDPKAGKFHWEFQQILETGGGFDSDAK